MPTYIVDDREAALYDGYRGSRCVFLEEQVLRDEEGVETPLCGLPLSQIEAVLRADRLVRRALADLDESSDGVPWGSILAPQIILYCVSKILRSAAVVTCVMEHTGRDRVWQTSNPVIAALVRDMDSTATVRCVGATGARALRSVRRVVPAIWASYETLGLWLKSNVAVASSIGRRDSCDVILWCHNRAHEPAAFAVADRLAETGASAVCVVGRPSNRADALNIRRFRTGNWAAAMMRHRSELRHRLDAIAQAIIRGVGTEDGLVTTDHLASTLREELYRRYLARAVDAWQVAGSALDLTAAETVMIQDVADYRTRAVAFQALRRGVRVVHHQFGDISHTCTDVEFGWDCADVHAVWGDGAKEFMSRLGIPSDHIRIVGSPMMADPGEQHPPPSGPASAGRRVLFPLFPCSSLSWTRFGNTAPVGVAESQQILKMVFRWAARAHPPVSLMLKPRPHRDDLWYRPLMSDAPPTVEVVSPDAPMGELLKHTDCVITTHSMVALEAMSMGIPVVLLPLATYRISSEQRPMVRLGLALEVSSDAELEQALEAIFGDPGTVDRMRQNQQRYCRSLIACGSGHSAVALADLVRAPTLSAVTAARGPAFA